MSQFTLLEQPRPFDATPSACAPRRDSPRSTVEALARVEFANFDLQGELAYEGRDFVRVLLARRSLAIADDAHRDCILVFDADEASASLPADEALGVLRPVQVYVLAAGLDRAAALEDRMESVIEGDERWGFALVRRSEGERPATVAPPIVEQLGDADRDERLPEQLRQLILCDGTHRVVSAVWNRRRALPAVAVLGEPIEPYYAYPQGADTWGSTASNVLETPPAPERKYRVRAVDLDSLEPAWRARVAAAPPSERYRRYFRDLTTGFGYMGGQGGREPTGGG
jgi:hypothetical protein